MQHNDFCDRKGTCKQLLPWMFFDSNCPQTSLMEATIGYSVAFSCVMSNRLCLNVRGMVGHEREDFSVATSINRLFDHIHTDSTFVREPQSTFTPECNVGDVNFVNESFHGVPQPVEDIERRGEAIWLKRTLFLKLRGLFNLGFSQFLRNPRSKEVGFLYDQCK